MTHPLLWPRMLLPTPCLLVPKKKLWTIQCFSESAYPRNFLSKYLFFGLECLPTWAISEATTVLQLLSMNQFLLESLTNLPREIFKNPSFYFGLEWLSKSPPSIIQRYSESSTTFSSFWKNLETHLLTEVEWRGQGRRQPEKTGLDEGGGLGAKPPEKFFVTTPFRLSENVGNALWSISELFRKFWRSSFVKQHFS